MVCVVRRMIQMMIEKNVPNRLHFHYRRDISSLYILFDHNCTRYLSTCVSIVFVTNADTVDRLSFDLYQPIHFPYCSIP